MSKPGVIQAKVTISIDAATKRHLDRIQESVPGVHGRSAAIRYAAAKAVAEAKIDSKKAAESFISRFRDSIAIALHTGRALPATELKAERPRPSKVEDRDQGRSR